MCEIFNSKFKFESDISKNSSTQETLHRKKTPQKTLCTKFSHKISLQQYFAKADLENGAAFFFLTYEYVFT